MQVQVWSCGAFPDTNKLHQETNSNVPSFTVAHFDGMKRLLSIFRVCQFVGVEKLHIQYWGVDQGCFGHSGCKIGGIPKTDGLCWDSHKYSCWLYAWLLQNGPLNPSACGCLSAVSGCG